MIRLRTILQYKYLFIIVLLLSICLSLFNSLNQKTIIDIDTNSLIGKITNISMDGDKYSFIIKSKELVKCTYYIKDINELEYLKSIKEGYEIRIDGVLSIPNNNTVPNTFNYKKYLKHKGINYVMNVNKINVLNTKINILYFIKNKLVDYINTFKSKNYLLSFIVGDKNLIDDDTLERYNDLGVSHIFSISGMHVSLLTGVLLVLLKKIKESFKFIIIILFLIFYMFITSFQPSILRSVVLFILVYINKKYYFNIKTINILYLTISILLLINYNLLFNIGFLYSSISSFALIKYSKVVNGNYFISLIKVSLLTFLFSLPLTVSITYQINILSFINNLIFVPLISLIIYPLSLIVLIIKPLDFILYFLCNIVELISTYLLVVKITIPKLNIVIVITYYIILIIYLESFNYKYLLLLIIMLLVYKYSYLLDNTYYIYYLDVSQGDSIIIKYKGNITMIDTGGKTSFKVEDWKKKKVYYYTDTTINFIHSLGLNKINNLITTHGDYDHMGEAINLVNNFKVDKVIFNCGQYNNLEKELIKILDKKKIEYYSCIKELNVDKNKLYFLQTKEYDNENDNSNVIYTKLNEYKFMLMGDAGVTTEKEILNKYNLSDIDVLKVGHHGSRTSSDKEFINEINPKYSIISVGKNNRYGHPNKEVLNTLENSKIYRTDQDGSIMFKIKNNKLKIETCSP